MSERVSEELPPLEVVAALLSAAGLRPPAEEVERLAGLYPGLQKTVERFHQVDVGDEVTAAVFNAEFKADPKAEPGSESTAS